MDTDDRFNAIEARLDQVSAILKAIRESGERRLLDEKEIKAEQDRKEANLRSDARLKAMLEILRNLPPH